MPTEKWRVDKKLDAFFKTVKQAYLEDKAPVTTELFEPYLEHRPEHAPAWFFYGAALHDVGLRSEAEKAYMKAL